MRLLLAIVAVVMAGIVAGVVTGKAIAGTTKPSEKSEVPGRLESGRPGDVMSSARGANTWSAPPPFSGLLDGDSQIPSAVSRGGITERNSENSDTTASADPGRPKAGPGEVKAVSRVSAVEPVYANPVFQVSGFSPSVLRIIDVIPGDADLDGVVTLEDVLLVAQAMGSVPRYSPVIVDWDGDGDVDVADLAVPASRLAG